MYPSAIAQVRLPIDESVDCMPSVSHRSWPETLIGHCTVAMVNVLLGVTAAGKSTVGRLLALELRWLYGDDRHPPANIEKLRQRRARRTRTSREYALA